MDFCLLVLHCGQHFLWLELFLFSHLSTKGHLTKTVVCHIYAHTPHNQHFFALNTITLQDCFSSTKRMTGRARPSNSSCSTQSPREFAYRCCYQHSVFFLTRFTDSERFTNVADPLPQMNNQTQMPGSSHRTTTCVYSLFMAENQPMRGIKLGFL